MTALAPVPGGTGTTIQKMSDAEIVWLMRQDSLLNRVRQIFSSEYAEIEQVGMQRKRPTIIEIRKMEFLAAQRFIKEVQDDAAAKATPPVPGGA